MIRRQRRTIVDSPLGIFSKANQSSLRMVPKKLNDFISVENASNSLLPQRYLKKTLGYIYVLYPLPDLHGSEAKPKTRQPVAREGGGELEVREATPNIDSLREGRAGHAFFSFLVPSKERTTFGNR